MKIVVDTNVILRALIKGSRVRGLLLSPKHQFYIPEYALEETKKHVLVVRRKTGLSEDEVERLFDILLTNLRVLPARKVAPKLDEALKLMRSIDSKDAPFVAAALGGECDGIWSDDANLKRQRKVRVWNTKEMMSLL